LVTFAARRDLFTQAIGAEMGSACVLVSSAQTNSEVRLAHCVFMTEFATEADMLTHTASHRALAEPLLSHCCKG